MTEPPSPEEDRLYLGIIAGLEAPEPNSFQAGRDDHAAGKLFHEGPQPFHTVAALSWRMGWNDRALQNRDG